MLVLTRRAGESVRIGSEIRVTVLSAAGGQIRIGIEAPSRIAVHREEVFDRIVAANLEAAAVASPAEVARLLSEPKQNPGGESR